jgi:hypothetical protein
MNQTLYAHMNKRKKKKKPKKPKPDCVIISFPCLRILVFSLCVLFGWYSNFLPGPTATAPFYLHVPLHVPPCLPDPTQPDLLPGQPFCNSWSLYLQILFLYSVTFQRKCSWERPFLIPFPKLSLSAPNIFIMDPV